MKPRKLKKPRSWLTLSAIVRSGKPMRHRADRRPKDARRTREVYDG